MPNAYKAIQATAPKYMTGDGDAYNWWDKFTASASLGVGDTIDFTIPAGAEIVSLHVQTDDLDSNGSPTAAFKVGYAPVDSTSSLAAVDNYFAVAGQTTMQAGGRLACSFKPIKFEEDVYVRITMTGATATFQAGDVIVIAQGNGIGVK